MSELGEIANRTYDNVGGVSHVALGISTRQKKVDAASSSTIYVGSSGPGVATSAENGWVIERIGISGTTVTIQHATGDWDSRASLSYT
jgi:hypothetical protein